MTFPVPAMATIGRIGFPLRDDETRNLWKSAASEDGEGDEMRRRPAKSGLGNDGDDLVPFDTAASEVEVATAAIALSLTKYRPSF